MVDETELIQAARGGNRSAFDELVRRTYTDLFTLAARLTGNEEDARDVVQEAYLRAWKGIGKGTHTLIARLTREGKTYTSFPVTVIVVP